LLLQISAAPITGLDRNITTGIIARLSSQGEHRPYRPKA